MRERKKADARPRKDKGKQSLVGQSRNLTMMMMMMMMMIEIVSCDSTNQKGQTMPDHFRWMIQACRLKDTGYLPIPPSRVPEKIAS